MRERSVEAGSTLYYYRAREHAFGTIFAASLITDRHQLNWKTILELGLPNELGPPPRPVPGSYYTTNHDVNVTGVGI